MGRKVLFLGHLCPWCHRTVDFINAVWRRYVTLDIVFLRDSDMSFSWLSNSATKPIINNMLDSLRLTNIDLLPSLLLSDHIKRLILLLFWPLNTNQLLIILLQYLRLIHFPHRLPCSPRILCEGAILICLNYGMHTNRLYYLSCLWQLVSLILLLSRRSLVLIANGSLGV